MTLAYKIVLVIAAIIASNLLIGTALWFLYNRTLRPQKWCWCELNRWLVQVVGATEKGAAVMLIFFAPSYLAPFVGGWIGLKYAAGWQANDAPFAREKSLMALVGTVWSFAIGIALGFSLNPDAMCYFADWRSHGH